MTIQYHELRPINIALLSTVPWLNMSIRNNRIHKIALSALYVCVLSGGEQCCSGGYDHATFFVCVRSVDIFSFILFAISCPLFFSPSVTVIK